MAKDKASKGGKTAKTAQKEAEASVTTASGFSLFGASKDTELDDVFSKGASYAAPVPITVNDPVPAVILSQPKPSKSPKKAKVADPLPAEEVVEQAEAGPSKAIAPAPGTDSEEDEEDAEDPEQADDNEDLVHESLKGKIAKSKQAKEKKVKKYVPADETSADRDRRTVFVGNLPIECAKSKPALHQLKTHLLIFAPTAKIESVRFRSVPFATPTAILPSEDPEKDESRRVKREKERASAWRTQQEEEGEEIGKGKGKRAREDDNDPDNAKVFLDAKGKRKVAFIKKDFHAEGGSCNAYVVFEHPHPERSKNVAPILDPFEAAELVLKANGSSFMERTIRVDAVRLPSSKALASASTALAKRDAWLPSGTDPKKSLFVGGLDYASKEEDLRAFFEEKVKEERGAAPDGGRWVTGVRIIRDQETQLGKGFGYVHFVDRESADEILALGSSKLKFAKRYIRVQPAKTLPSSVAKSTPTANGKAAPTAEPKSASGKTKTVPRVRPAPAPKGNPLLGEKLKDLSKEERKLAKATDADRQARRLAKKKMRSGMSKQTETGAVKLNPSKGEKHARTKPKAKKGRVRSEKAVAKMKGQRQ